MRWLAIGAKVLTDINAPVTLAYAISSGTGPAGGSPRSDDRLTDPLGSQSRRSAWHRVGLAEVKPDSSAARPSPRRPALLGLRLEIDSSVTLTRKSSR